MDYKSTQRYLKVIQDLIIEFPYYIPVLNRARFFSGNRSVQTMAIDANLVIYVNDDFANALSDSELHGLILHELLHYVNNHHERYMNNPYKEIIPHSIHNIAMDLEVNEIVQRYKQNPEIIFSRLFPESMFKAKDFRLPKNKSYEEYLAILHNKMPKKLKDLSKDITSGKQKIPLDDINMEGYSQINKEILYELLEECKKIYNEQSNSITRTIGKKKYPWDIVLRNLLVTKIADMAAGFKYRTYLKPNRRYPNTDVIFPAFIDYRRKINLAIIMDVSGSMGYFVNLMYSVIKSIVDIQELDIKCIILETAFGVQRVIEDFNFNTRQIESSDGGGTQMPSGWHFLIDNKMDKDMDLIICMTDTYTDWEPLLVEKSVVLGSQPIKPYDCPYEYFPVIFDDFNTSETMLDYIPGICFHSLRD